MYTRSPDFTHSLRLTFIKYLYSRGFQQLYRGIQIVLMFNF